MSAIDEPLHGGAADEVRDQLREYHAQEVGIARRTAQQMLDRYGPADIHNHGAMVEAHGALTATLERLLGALDARDGAA